MDSVSSELAQVKVSIVIPAHNSAQTIRETLDSLLNQTHKNWQAIIVNNCSSDNTNQIVTEYLNRDARFILVDEKIKGVSRARNTGIKSATADWLLFLDSDDWLLPEALEKLTFPVLTDGEIDAVYCGAERYSSEGKLIPIKSLSIKGDLFEHFSRGVPFPIHACLVRRVLVEKVKAFDSNINYGEDWDLWLRCARAGANFFSISERLAIYRMREKSATLDPILFTAQHQILIQATKKDYRIDCADPRHENGVGDSNLARNALELLSCCAALLIGQDREAKILLDELADYQYQSANHYFIASAFYDLIPIAKQVDQSFWPNLYHDYLPKIKDFLLELEQSIGVSNLSILVVKALEHYVLQGFNTKQDLVLHYSASKHLDLSQPLEDLKFPANIEILHLHYSYLGEDLNVAKFPIFDCLLPADVIRDLVSSWNWWHILKLYFEKYYYSKIEIKRSEYTYDYYLGDFHLASSSFENREQATREIHNVVWWNLLDREISLSISNSSGKDELINKELSSYPKLLVREMLVGQSFKVETIAKRIDSLNSNPARYSTVIGRHPAITSELSAGTKSLLPSAIHQDLEDAARSLGQKVEIVGDCKPVKIFYNPEVSEVGFFRKEQYFPEHAKKSKITRLYDRNFFENSFLNSSDPWDFTSSYEQLKYKQTLDILPEGKYLKALELASAGGHFTSLLAQRVEKLDVADISSIALNQARERSSEFTNKLCFKQLDFVNDEILGKYNLIICSEALYYGCRDKESMGKVAEKITNALELGGYFVSANANVFGEEPGAPGFDWPENFGAATIRDVFLEHKKLSLVKEFYTPLYKIFLFKRVPENFISPVTWERVEVELSLTERVNKQVCWDPARVKSRFVGQEIAADSLPVLLYHRIADDVAGPLSRYAVTKENFNVQMKYLRDAGYYTIDLKQWSEAVEKCKPLPGRPILITFDDGYEDFYTNAWPILTKYKYSALVFLVADLIGGINIWDRKYSQEIPLMNWSQIEKLRAEGVVFGSHSLTHKSLSTISSTEALREIYLSRAILEEKLGYLVEAFAAPYGDEGALVQSLVRISGYRYAFTTNTKKCSINDKYLYALPRIEIFGSDSFEDFVRKLS